MHTPSDEMKKNEDQKISASPETQQHNLHCIPPALLTTLLHLSTTPTVWDMYKTSDLEEPTPIKNNTNTASTPPLEHLNLQDMIMPSKAKNQHIDSESNRFGEGHQITS